jgi:hypothetical protein
MQIIADFEITGWDEEPELTYVRKRFTGAMEGTSVARLLTAGDDGRGQGYVASEEVTATIDGRAGTFVLQHGGVVSANGEVLFQFGIVVPGTATGELAGLTGTARYEHTEAFARVTLDVEL